MVELARRRFTTDEFHHMVECGVLGKYDRLELIEGEIIEMRPIGTPHARCVRTLNRLFAPLAVRGQALVDVQNALDVGRRSEVYPDVMLLRPQPDDYATRHPRPGDVLLLVEVSDTTLDYDQGVKLRLYARAGISEVWIVDLTGEAVLVHRQPLAETYADVQSLSAERTLAPAAFPDFELAVGDILG
jgi:Uma2 family endonuclease